MQGKAVGRFVELGLFMSVSCAAFSSAEPATVGSTPPAIASPWAVTSLVSSSPERLGIAGAVVVVMIVIVWWHARHNTTFRDDLLPQLAPEQQPYSLARWQMAFWFTLIFASFAALFVLFGNYNIVPPQALGLMGISGATALSAVAVDVIKDSPADRVNRGLQALGLNSYDDVLRVRQEIADREAQVVQSPPPGQLAQLQAEIQDRQNILQTYEDKVAPFVTQGWFKDLTTDLNGTAIHRLQVLCWTCALGAVFVVEVIRNLAMPAFDTTLLALMGISSAGYVGFKYPEAND